jgi:hypothetical protein
VRVHGVLSGIAAVIVRFVVVRYTDAVLFRSQAEKDEAPARQSDALTVGAHVYCGASA